MKKIVILLFVFFTSLSVLAQDADKKHVLQMLSDQERDWNAGSLENFMSPYWKSDSLMFIGKSGITYGWDNTLANYKRSYPDAEAMGKLTFEVIDIRRLSVLYFYVTGKWQLERTGDDLSGHFTLLIKKIGKRWVIVSDHSS